MANPLATGPPPTKAPASPRPAPGSLTPTRTSSAATATRWATTSSSATPGNATGPPWSPTTAPRTPRAPTPSWTCPEWLRLLHLCSTPPRVPRKARDRSYTKPLITWGIIKIRLRFFSNQCD